MIRLRHLLSLLLVAALIAVQWSGTLHALSHAEYELALATQAKSGGDAPAPLDHARDRCVAWHALDCALDASPVVAFDAPAALVGTHLPCLTYRPTRHLAYASRAPPVLHALS